MKSKFSEKGIPFRKILGQIIAERRTAKGISRRLFAYEYGLEYNMLTRLETGISECGISSYLAVSEALGTDGIELLAEAYKRLPKDFTFLDW